MATREAKTPLSFTAVDEIPASVRASSSTHQLLTAFVESGAPNGVVPIPEDRKADTVRGMLDSYIKRHEGFPVKVKSVNGSIYLVNTTLAAADSNGADPA